MNLADVDLVRTICPRGTEIEIEGWMKMGVDIPGLNLITAIAQINTIATGTSTLVDDAFLRRVTLIGLDLEKKQVKVRIVSPA